jgi:lipopolysaccharide biosynthesis regulator YciM
MIQVDPSWLLALPLLFAFGWLSARLESRQTRARQEVNLTSLVRAVQSLAAGHKTQAVSPLLEAARESPELLGIQQALADLFRAQGEPDRAIEVRLSLLARSGLSPEVSEALLFELAQDYLAAGIMDRAEACFEALRGTGLSAEAAHFEVAMYQQQRRWTDALAALDRHTGLADDDARRFRFHFLIEAGRAAEARTLWPDHPRVLHAQGAHTGRHLCVTCGFRTEQHYSQCPGCMAWDSLTPLMGNARPSSETQPAPASIA